jgi:ribosomal protein S16
MKDPADLKLDLARVDYWVGQGAQPSDTCKRLIERARTASA